MVATIILFLFQPPNAFSQFKEKHSLTETATIEGVAKGIDNYYRNLIVQDLALAEGKSTSEVTIRFDFRLNLEVDKCTPDRIEISVMPVCVSCDPHFYREFDISSSLKPGAADLVFHIRNQLGLVSDSIIFSAVPMETDSSLFTARWLDISPVDGNVTPVFARGTFRYDKSCYDAFRDNILIIDEYYAASALADSTYKLIRNGFLSEIGNCPEILLRQAEIDRISRFVHPSRFDSLTGSGMNDPALLSDKFRQLQRSSMRYQTLLKQTNHNRPCFTSPVTARKMVNTWLDWQDYYRQMAYNSDYKFISFFEEAAIPAFTNSLLSSWLQMLNIRFDGPESYRQAVIRIMILSLAARAEGFESSGLQMLALRYYQSAMKLSLLAHQRDMSDSALLKVCQMKQEIMRSYLRISNLAAEKDNPQLAVEYYHRARDIYHSNHLPCVDKDVLTRFEQSMYQNFETRVRALIKSGKYRKANAFLQEIHAHCSQSLLYPCPDEYPSWMSVVTQGIYDEMIREIRRLIARDELAEAEQAYFKARELRVFAGHTVRPDKDEPLMERRFRQMYYDDFIDEGIRYFNREEYNLALYYFSKAYKLETGYLPTPRKELPSYRDVSSRQVISHLLSDTRLKIWAYDFLNARHFLDQAENMLEEFHLPDDDPLVIEYKRLNDEVYLSKCVTAKHVYDDLMDKVFQARKEQDFIKARQFAGEAVNHSMNNIDCRIRDEQAWYQKVLLESLAGFQEMEIALDSLAVGSPEPYLKAFQELNTYYSRKRLLDQGVIFIPLKDRVVKVKDIEFLTGVFDHYVRMTDPEQCLAILQVLQRSGADRKALADRQRVLAQMLAKRDASGKDDEIMPWETMRSYVGNDPWFKPFRCAFKKSWLKETRVKFRYWPLIWKK